MNDFPQPIAVNLTQTSSGKTPGKGAGIQTEQTVGKPEQGNFSEFHAELQIIPDDTEPQLTTRDDFISLTPPVAALEKPVDKGASHSGSPSETTPLTSSGALNTLRQTVSREETSKNEISSPGGDELIVDQPDTVDRALDRMTAHPRGREIAGSLQAAMEFIQPRAADPAAISTSTNIVEAAQYDAVQSDNVFEGKIGQIGLSSSERFLAPASQINIASPSSAVRQQVIAAIIEKGDQTKIEIKLDPPELGRITIDFEGDGKRLVRAVVAAESPQTIDMLRRNLDILQRELASSGFENIDLQMGDHKTAHHTREGSDDIKSDFSDDASSDAGDGITTSIHLVPDGRLDRRI